MRKILLCFFLFSASLIAAEEHLEVTLPQEMAEQWQHQKGVGSGSEDGECPCCDGIKTLDVWVNTEAEEMLVAATYSLESGIPDSLQSYTALLQSAEMDFALIEQLGENDCILKISDDILFSLERLIWTDEAFHLLNYCSSARSEINESKWVAIFKEARVVQ